MSVIEDRLRSALTARAEEVSAGALRPFELPPARRRPGRRWAWRGAAVALVAGGALAATTVLGPASRVDRVEPPTPAPGPYPVDLDGDGVEDVVEASQQGRITLHLSRDGDVVHELAADEQFVGVADLDADQDMVVIETPGDTAFADSRTWVPHVWWQGSLQPLVQAETGGDSAFTTYPDDPETTVWIDERRRLLLSSVQTAQSRVRVPVMRALSKSRSLVRQRVEEMCVDRLREPVPHPCREGEEAMSPVDQQLAHLAPAVTAVLGEGESRTWQREPAGSGEHGHGLRRTESGLEVWLTDPFGASYVAPLSGTSPKVLAGQGWLVSGNSAVVVTEAAGSQTTWTAYVPQSSDHLEAVPLPGATSGPNKGGPVRETWLSAVGELVTVTLHGVTSTGVSIGDIRGAPAAVVVWRVVDQEGSWLSSGGISQPVVAPDELGTYCYTRDGDRRFLDPCSSMTAGGAD
jgi:hypothetical protein